MADKKMPTFAETVAEITRIHLKENNGVALGQCLTAVGWVGGTVPQLTQEDDLVELSMADVSGGYIACGYAREGRRPIYIVRYQGFQWFNAPGYLNYAAKAKEMWGTPCPIFVRSIAMDGGMGPVASGSHHGIATRMPGIKVCAPMTPLEYHLVWNRFMRDDDPYYVSEHRRSFSITHEMDDMLCPHPDIVLFPISSTRLNAIDAEVRMAREGIRCSIIHVLWLKPFVVSEKIGEQLRNAKYGGLVIDGDYENSTAKCIAYDMMRKTGKPVDVLCLGERAAGFAPQCDNIPPTPEKIYQKVKEIISR